jgi:hypothetical protein
MLGMHAQAGKGQRMSLNRRARRIQASAWLVPRSMQEELSVRWSSCRAGSVAGL